MTASPTEPIDRIGPTLRPRGPMAMWQTWSHLLFLHWEASAGELRRLVPPWLEIDTFEGRAYVGLVPFTMSGIRLPYAPPVPGLSRFHELNVRTYVHHEGRDPGVWFFSLDAANSLACRAARTFFRLPYHHARMSMTVSTDGEYPVIDYTSARRGVEPGTAVFRAHYGPTGPPSHAVPGTLEHFLMERYILYCEGRASRFRGRVHHQPYPAQSANVWELEENMLAANDITPGRGRPLVHYASRVQVRIFPLERIR